MLRAPAAKKKTTKTDEVNDKYDVSDIHLEGGKRNSPCLRHLQRRLHQDLATHANNQRDTSSLRTHHLSMSRRTQYADPSEASH